MFDALPLSYGGDIVLDSTPFNVQLDGRGLAGWVDGWARVWKRSCTVSHRDDLRLPPRRAVGGGCGGGVHCAVAGFCKACELDDTGDPFRSGDLGVMSPARLPLRHAGEGCCVVLGAVFCGLPSLSCDGPVL